MTSGARANNPSAPWWTGVVSLLLLSTVLSHTSPSLFTPAKAESENTAILLEVTIQSPPIEREWYTKGDLLNLSLTLFNNGDTSKTISINPSCPATFTITTLPGGIAVWDEANHADCRNQSQSWELQPYERKEMGSLTWNFTKDDGSESPGGVLLIQVEAVDTEIATALQVNYQPQTELHPSLQIRGVLVPPSFDGEIYQSGDMLRAAASLVNTGGERIPLNFPTGCKLEMVASRDGEVLYEELTDISCQPHSHDGFINSGEFIHLGWHQWDFLYAGGDEGPEGEFDLRLQVPGHQDNALDMAVILVDREMKSPSHLHGEEGPLSLALGLTPSPSAGSTYFMGDEVLIEPIIINQGTEEETLSFHTACLTQLHVVGQNGRIVADSRDGRVCPEMESIHQLESGETLEIEKAIWDFTDQMGCEIENGDYMMFLSVWEYRLGLAHPFKYIGGGTGAACRIGQQNFSSLEFNVKDINAGETDNSTIHLLLELSNSGEEVTLLWTGSCELQATLSSTNGIIDEWGSNCGQGGERPEKISEGDSLYLPLTVTFTDSADIWLPSGNHTVNIVTNSIPQFELQIGLEWRQPVTTNETVPNNQTNETKDDNATEEILDAFLIEGVWNVNDEGICPVLTSESGTRYLLTGSESSLDWVPRNEIMGTYLVLNGDSSASTCSIDGIFPIYLFEVLNEEEKAEIDQVGPTSTKDPTIIKSAPVVLSSTAIVAVSSGLLGIGFATNESIRIPFSRRWLLFLGLITRRGNDIDGDYQRGRIMGYLAANPGCHFRALLAELEMSNGQLAHHLKVLEGKERIWRRKDGRLVRFYPYSGKLNPSTKEEDLPIPPLAPDPNSLQGKILALLDHDGQMKKYPSQRELAQRLEASQQLISHHLRTLEKFDLVTREKKGVKFHYKLTLSARYLLDSGSPRR